MFVGFVTIIGGSVLVVGDMFRIGGGLLAGGPHSQAARSPELTRGCSLAAPHI